MFRLALAKHASTSAVLPVSLFDPWLTVTSNVLTSKAAPRNPINAAPKTIIGNGTLKKKMPTNATAANAFITRFFRDRLPARIMASRTIASAAPALRALERLC